MINGCDKEQFTQVVLVAMSREGCTLQDLANIWLAFMSDAGWWSGLNHKDFGYMVKFPLWLLDAHYKDSVK